MFVNLTIPFQTELAINTNIVVTDTHVMVTDIHRNVLAGQGDASGQNHSVRVLEIHPQQNFYCLLG